MIDSDTAKRIQTLERTVDILSFHLLNTCLMVEELTQKLPDADLHQVSFGIRKNINLLKQVQKLNKQ